MLSSFPKPLPPKRPVTWTPARFFPYRASSTWTFTVPYDGWYRICAVGAGASGGAIFRTTSCGGASGGGGGGYVEKEVYLYKDQTLNITPGLGGAVATSSVSGTGVNGNNGTDTTVIGPNIYMVAGGGLAGIFTITNTTQIAGGVGGGFSGGDFGFPGGAGGSVTFATNGAPSSGGGAAGSPAGIGGDGGICTTSAQGASGGGAIGGMTAGASTGTSSKSGGAGTGGPSVAVAGSTQGAGGNNRLGFAVRSSADGELRGGLNSTSVKDAGFETIFNPFYSLTGGGGAGNLSASGGTGAGGGGNSNIGGSTAFTVLGGGGGASGTVAASTAAGSYVGGGGGGCASATTGPAISGIGGNGLVTIERIG